MAQLDIKDLGICDVEFDGTSLGQSVGAVIFKEVLNEAPVKENSKGDVDDILTGSLVTVDVPLGRSSLLELSKVMPHAVYNAVAGTLVMMNPINISLASKAKELILKPVVDGLVSTTPTDWLTVYKCAPRTTVELPFDEENQRTYAVLFKAYPNDGGAKWGMAEPVV